MIGRGDWDVPTIVLAGEGVCTMLMRITACKLRSPRTFNSVIQGFVFLHKPPGWEVDGGMDAGRLVLISSISSIFKSCSISPSLWPVRLKL